MRKQIFLFILITVFSFSWVKAQSPVKQQPSPLAMVTYKYGETYIKITYCRPAKRNRAIFGELVPYGKVWRTGANEATEITITKDIKMAGDSVKAGTYTLFSIPEKDNWTIILNKELGQWGAFKYDPRQDYKRLEATVSPMESVYEVFAIEFESLDSTPGKVNILLKWDKTKVTIPLELSAGNSSKDLTKE
ncbi:MAG TPA: DUF2911 domain-containing protein [Cytophagales bacterium]|nr:DUF2911 domain-containing protein [Cytophagales bacterium]